MILCFIKVDEWIHHFFDDKSVLKGKCAVSLGEEEAKPDNAK